MIAEKNLDLFYGKQVAHVATLNPDGTIQISPVWIDYDKSRDLILFNTARGRKKDRNLKVGSPVAISINDPANIYRYVAVQGEVVEITEDGALDHINQLSKRYRNQDKYDLPEGQIRMKVYVKPVHTLQR